MHHYHKRKRIHEKHEPFPHPDPVKNFLDKMVYALAVGGPLMLLPQVYKIYSEQTAAGISILTWWAFMIISLVWIAYGILHREKPIILTNILLFLLNGAVCVGVLLYR